VNPDAEREQCENLHPCHEGRAFRRHRNVSHFQEDDRPRDQSRQTQLQRDEWQEEANLVLDDACRHVVVKKAPLKLAHAPAGGRPDRRDRTEDNQ